MTRSILWLGLALWLSACGAPPPVEPPPLPSSPVLATIVLAREGKLVLRQMRIAIPGSLLNPDAKLVDGFTLRLDGDATRRIALADLRRIVVVGRELNRLKIRVLTTEALEGTVEAGLLLRGEGELGLLVKVSLEETRSITVQR